MTGDYHNGEHRHRTFPSLQKVLLDAAGCPVAKFRAHSENSNEILKKFSAEN